jgi:predicted transcriptional regulator
MRTPKPPALTKRERQIMDVLYALGQATAAEIQARLDDPPTYTTVRGLIRILESKGHVSHHREGARFVFTPSTPREHAGASSLTHVVRTFFDGSPAKALAALIGTDAATSDEELQRLELLIKDQRARSTRRKR